MKKTELGILALALIIVPAGYVLGSTQGGTGGTQGTPPATSSHPVANAPATSASATPPRNDSALIERLERDRAAAVVKGDWAKIERETAEDAIFIDRNGHVRDKAQTIAGIRSGEIKLASNELSGLQVRVYGDTAVVSGKSYAKGSIGGKGFTGPAAFLRVYVKKNGNWQSVAFEQTPIVP
jgi:ketosteroid isomerase-like protein